jgi:hypothetical protein
MTTVLIIVCIAFCIGVIVAIVGHMGYAITRDKAHRGWLHRYHVTRARRHRRPTATS